MEVVSLCDVDSKMLNEAAQFVRNNPVSDEIKKKRQRFWAKQNGPSKSTK